MFAARTSFGGNDKEGDAKGDGKTVFIKGFDTTWSEDDLKTALTEAFTPYGEVEDIRLPYDRENDCRKGFGYVVFAEATGANVRIRLSTDLCSPLCLMLSLNSMSGKVC
jgi:RNA recognition motif-containing protein